MYPHISFYWICLHIYLFFLTGFWSVFLYDSGTPSQRYNEMWGCRRVFMQIIRSCLSSSRVKLLTIWNFGGLCDDYDDDIEKQTELHKYFLKTMPNLVQMILYIPRYTNWWWRWDNPTSDSSWYVKSYKAMLWIFVYNFRC